MDRRQIKPTRVRSIQHGPENGIQTLGLDRSSPVKEGADVVKNNKWGKYNSKQREGVKYQTNGPQNGSECGQELRDDKRQSARPVSPHVL